MDAIEAFFRDPVVRYLLTLGLIAVAYSWLWVPIVKAGLGELWKKAVKKGDLGTFLTATVGHGAVTILTAVATADIASTQPEARALYAVIALAFLWITACPELFEDHAGSPSQDRGSRWIVLLRLLVILGWMAFLWCLLYGVVPFPTQIPRALLMEWMDRAWRLPYQLGILFGLAGAWALFRSLFKAIFATAGVLDLIVRSRAPATP